MKQINLFAEETHKKIKNGEIPEKWENEPHKLSQKDTDTRWTKKCDEKHYGYKDHVKVDADSKLILDYAVTPTNVHDSNEFEDFFSEQDEVGYADSAYAGKKLPKHVRNEVCEKGYRNKPLTKEQKENNRRKSKIRCRIEHVFGFMTMSMHGLTIRSIGIKRATFNIGLTNFVYNLCRYSFLSRKETAAEQLYPFAGNARNFEASTPNKYMKFEAEMRFADLISFFRC